MRGIQSNTMILCAPGNRGASLLSRRAHLLTTPKGRWYCLRQPCALRGGCGFCGSLMDNATSRRCCCHCPRSYRKHTRFCVYVQGVHFVPHLAPTANEKHQPDVFHCYGHRFFCDTHFLFARKKQKQERKDGENEWRSTTWKPRWSAEVRDDLRLPLPLI